MTSDGDSELLASSLEEDRRGRFVEALARAEAGEDVRKELRAIGARWALVDDRGLENIIARLYDVDSETTRKWADQLVAHADWSREALLNELLDRGLMEQARLAIPVSGNLHDDEGLHLMTLDPIARWLHADTQHSTEDLEYALRIVEGCGWSGWADDMELKGDLKALLGRQEEARADYEVAIRALEEDLVGHELALAFAPFVVALTGKIPTPRTRERLEALKVKTDAIGAKLGTSID